ncbi:MAG TPA: tripartite tricarboxylate transporter substrate binding protein [Steroidobacteraceae bacterium]|nr:tripartite tricarboxylate transporter substrate binding protein [Steroidobacteraceae bacterium]
MVVQSSSARIFIVAMVFACGFAAAQSYPAKPVRMLVPFPPGGGTDYTARLISQKLTEIWGQQVIVDNRPGASTTIASEIVAKAPADGYTLIMGSTNHTINPSLYPRIPYDTIKDFAPVTVAVTASYVLVVHPSLPAKTVKELIALARTRPGEINYASSGSSGPQHIAGELFKLMAKVDMTHVPYKGGGPAVVALLGGHVQAQFSTPVSALPHVRTGKLRALGVTSLKRSDAIPEVPTISEAALPGYEAVTWWGILAPARTPREIVDKIHGDTVKALQMPDTLDKLAREGVNPAGTTPEQFATMIQVEMVKMGKIVKAANMKID